MNRRILRKVLDPWILRRKDRAAGGVQWDPGGSGEAAVAWVPRPRLSPPHRAGVPAEGTRAGCGLGRASLGRMEAADWVGGDGEADHRWGSASLLMGLLRGTTQAPPLMGEGLPWMLQDSPSRNGAWMQRAPPEATHPLARPGPRPCHRAASRLSQMLLSRSLQTSVPTASPGTQPHGTPPATGAHSSSSQAPVPCQLLVSFGFSSI